MAATITMTIAGRTCKFLRKDWLALVEYHPNVVETLLSMSFSQAEKSLGGSMYCFPSQSWLAKQVGHCRKTINLVVKFLRKYGFICTKWRAPRKGRYRTLLYFPGPVILKAMGCAASAVQALVYRVTDELHISYSERNILRSKALKDEKPHKLKGAPDENDPWVTLFERRPELA